ncbi:MAG: DUF4124 domain-containing protein, partial [Woeseia sp.]|nr:DUF4124 domain-containing protein [Woeseia sp.]
MHKCRISAVVLFLCAAAASAQVYKWTDADGVVHYSDQPTPGAEIIDIQENTIRTRRARV